MKINNNIFFTGKNSHKFFFLVLLMQVGVRTSGPWISSLTALPTEPARHPHE